MLFHHHEEHEVDEHVQEVLREGHGEALRARERHAGVPGNQSAMHEKRKTYKKKASPAGIRTPAHLKKTLVQVCSPRTEALTRERKRWCHMSWPGWRVT